MAVFKGSAVALVTPMNADRTVNYTKLDELIEMHIARKTDAIVICGTTGEASTLSKAEHLDAIKHCVETVNGRIPVIAGTGSNCTETAIYLSQEAEKYGADALLVVTPYYNKSTQKGLIKHYTAVAESVSLPIIMYNVPSRTGCNLQPKTIAALANNVKNIVGIKEASGDISQVAKIQQLCGEDFELYSGNDDQVIPLLSLGGLGVISVLANVAPEYAHDMVMEYLDGNTRKALDMQLEALDLIDALFCEVNPIPVKVAMNLLGYECGPMRPPMCEMEPEHEAQLKKALQDFKLL